MIAVAWIAFWILIGLSIVSALLAYGFGRILRRPQPEPLADDACPKAAVILCLRGVDPFLTTCLQSLLNQDYPQYDVWIVVDHQADPAWEVVQQVIRETGARHIHVRPLRQRLDTTTLLNSSLIQAVSELDASYEVMAMVDADTITPPQWLRALVTPLADRRIGATYGNRWCAPLIGRWGSLVRYVWMAGGAAPMHYFEMPWGGSLAMRLSTVRRAGIVDLWARTRSSDAPLRSALHALGLRLQFVPSLMMINREECDLGFCLYFMGRQLNSNRLYHPGWLGTLLHALVSAGALAVAVALVVLGLITGHMDIVVWAGAGVAAYWLTMMACLVWLETSVQSSLQRRGETPTPLTWGRWLRVALCIPLAQEIHLLAALIATFQRRVVWRGVTYHIHGPHDIRLVYDQATESMSQEADKYSSL